MPCPGFTSTHAVSDLGRVRSINRTVSTSRGPRQKKGKVLTPDRSRPDGYARVNLHVNGKSTPKTIHGLVARAFLGPPPGPVGSKRDEYTVDHLDGDKANNRADNLEWVTSEENRRRAMERGTIPCGSAHPRSKLTADDVREMRALHAAGGHTYEALAERFGISRSQVGQIVQRKAWRHVE